MEVEEIEAVMTEAVITEALWRLEYLTELGS
jgi:hypothetical protein